MSDFYHGYWLGVATIPVLIIVIWLLYVIVNKTFIGWITLENRWQNGESLKIYAVSFFQFGVAYVSKLANHNAMSMTLARQRKRVVKVWGRKTFEFKKGTFLLMWPDWITKVWRRFSGVAH